jgi:hypothetical protein
MFPYIGAGEESQAHEVLQVLLCNIGRGPVLFHHVLRGKEQQHSLSPQNLPFRSFSLSLSLFRHREGDEETMGPCEAQ